MPAFPGAEGGGAWTPGGRGGKVLVVTSLDDSGPGTLREAVEASGPRIVVFGVAGHHHAATRRWRSTSPFITHRRPDGPGRRRLHPRRDDRRSTRTTSSSATCGSAAATCSAATTRSAATRSATSSSTTSRPAGGSTRTSRSTATWRRSPAAASEKLPAENLTIQWSISSEALNLNNHAFGGTWGGKNCSFHHNLFACNTGRNPSIGMSGGFDFRNNVALQLAAPHDGRRRRQLAGQRHQQLLQARPGDRRASCATASARPRPATPATSSPASASGTWTATSSTATPRSRPTTGPAACSTTRRRRQGRDHSGRHRSGGPLARGLSRRAGHARTRPRRRTSWCWPTSGPSLPRRDPVDVRVIESVRTGKPTFERRHHQTPADVGGWPEYKAAAMPADADRDGMPDDWEKAARPRTRRTPADAAHDGDATATRTSKST